MDILLVRHGESTANAEGRMQGRREYSLSPRGRAQADRLGRWLAASGLEFDTVYSSPQARARETAAILTASLGLPEAQLDDDLCELHAGSLEGLTHQEMLATHPNYGGRPITEIGDFSRFGGESYGELEQRIARLVDRWKAEHRERGGRLLVVAHGGFNQHLVKTLVTVPVARVMNLRFGNCTATLVRMRDKMGSYVGEIVFHLPVELLPGGEVAWPPPREGNTL